VAASTQLENNHPKQRVLARLVIASQSSHGAGPARPASGNGYSVRNAEAGSTAAALRAGT
jgi:hypothetical protein